MKSPFAYILAFLFVPYFNAAHAHPFQNPALGAEQRIDNLLSLMTLEEKIQCLSTNPSIPRLGVEGAGHVEGLHGLALGGPGDWGRGAPVPTTTFPQAYGLGESWDIDAIKAVAVITAKEARYIFQNKKYRRGGLVIRAPNADLARDPRWGRTEESYGEDAWFNGVMAATYVQALQGDAPDYWQAASLLKHFLANSNEDNRERSSSNFDERLLHEYYAKPFQMAVEEGGSKAFMTAYNAVNHIPMILHPMLQSIPVEQWGQNGIICTDGGAFRLLLEEHKYFTDPHLAAAAVIKAGINQFLDTYKEAVHGALKMDYLTEQDLDRTLRGVFRVMIKLGQLDPADKVPYRSVGINDTREPWLTDAHKKIVRDVTNKTIVLLKNKHKTLPLKREKLRSIALVGPLADNVFLDWYSGTPPYVVTAVDGIRRKAGKDIDVLYKQGQDTQSAVSMAKSADVAIVLVGNHPYCNAEKWKQCDTPGSGREAVDRKSLTLEEEKLIKKVYAVNKNTVVVLISSFPYAINWTQKNVPAIVHMTHNSQELGHSLADVLFGDYNPAGRLTQTWVASMSQLPDMMDYNIRNGRTYMYFNGKPLYAFGYGLSYTTFRYSRLSTSSEVLSSDSNGEIVVSVDVKNTGPMAGDEVVQLYVKHMNSQVERPRMELKGFKRLYIPPGKTKNIAIPLRAKDLAFWDIESKRFVVEKNKIQLMVGASSNDIRLKKKIKVVD